MVIINSITTQDDAMPSTAVSAPALNRQPPLNVTALGTEDQEPLAGGTLVDSEDLLQGRKAVTIQHNGALYRLQATRLGKLILTK